MRLHVFHAAAICSLICFCGAAPVFADGKARRADRQGRAVPQRVLKGAAGREAGPQKGGPSPKGHATTAPGAVPRKLSPEALAKRIATARESLARLERDLKRRAYRDGWDSIIKDLDAAVATASPAAQGAQVAEAELLAAHAREGLWAASRRKVDAQAAIAAYRQVEVRHQGREPGQRALVAAVRLAHRVSDKKELAVSARRLALYPRGAEVREALALAGQVDAPEPKPAPAAPAAPATGVAGLLAQARPVRASDRVAALPVDDDESDQADAKQASKPAAAAAPAAAPAMRAAATTPAAKPLSATRASRAGRAAPPSPEREPDTDVPAEAAHVLDAMVQAVRDRGAADLLGEPRAPSPAPGAGDAPAASAPATSAAPTSAREVAGSSAAEEASADDGPPEPEEPDEVPLPHRTRASAPKVLAGEDADPDSEQKARTLRSALLAGGPSVAEQLGLKIRTIAIDAGHGGRDTGAIGPKGLREKDATLAIARKVAARLKALGFTVVMTRDSDGYVALRERTRIANEAGADLFLSVHCNAAKKRGLSGVETWTLNTTSDRYSQRLAAFENAEADATVGNLRLILADLATKANAGDARELATAVQASLVRTLRSRVGKVKDHGVKHALFYVLLGTHMPAILVETAFLSNPEEEKRLRSPKYQDGAAEAISRGVKDFLDSRRRLARAQ